MKRRGNKGKKPFARKRFGQHYLTDQSIIEQIIANSNLKNKDHVIEIGPGRGALTRPLAEQGVELTIVELDWNLVDSLKIGFKNNSQVQIIEGDILKIDWKTLFKAGKTNKIVANLPYNISTPVFFKMVSHRHLLDSIVIMVQKELAQRLQHSGKEKKLKDYGILSVVAGNTFSVKKVCDVPASCFSPPPKVNSTVIRLEPKEMNLADEDRFFVFVRKAFNNRRKLFTSFLQREYDDLYRSLSSREREHLKGLRPENLLPEQYLRLFLRQSLLD